MQRTVLITGTSSGIGKATVEMFALAGWNVAATARSLAKLDFSHLPSVRMYQLDVTDDSSITDAFKNAVKDFGKINVVVNNAGYALDGVFESMDDKAIQKQFDTNVFGLMRVSRAALRHMRPNQSGTIIQVASMGGRLTFPLYSIYHSTKWAVEGFSESLSYEAALHGVNIKIIEPGVIKTAFYTQSRHNIRPLHSLGYDKFVKKVDAVSQRAGQNGKDPSVVARVIVKAATDKSNRIRYAVGSPAPQLLLLRKILPERMFLYFVRKNYKI
ncbi:SDR family oxidoreductase [Candidatus Saccharibacteria bacterium]|nr:SDR family oxidoreductase [Candidatus Saccharibacteria bacterium]